jgi:hypothetical protein
MSAVPVSPRVPAPFLVLGAAGLLPFLAGAALAWFGPPGDNSMALHWLLGYAMVILTFVAALHWGVAMMAASAAPADRWLAAGWSVLPPLVAWIALQLATVHGIQLLIAMFVVQVAMDRWLARRFPVPAWFFRLRLALTLVVVAALAVALVAYYRAFG